MSSTSSTKNKSLIPTRGYRGGDDLQRIVDLNNLGYEAEHIEDIDTLDEIKQLYEQIPNFDIQRDLIFADAPTGETIAFARTRFLDEVDGPRRHLSIVKVHPAWRRHGVGVMLLRWLEARVAEKHREAPVTHAVIESWIDAPSGVAFAERNGYTLSRRAIEMSRSLAEPIPGPMFPPGFELRPVDASQLRAIFDADINAFRDHVGFSEPDAGAFDRWRSGTLFQPEYWQVLWHIESGEVAAQVLNHVNHAINARFNLKRGFTEDISTQRQFRRMGLARNLIFASMRMFKDMGMDHVTLGADADNLTGAVRVYESCGYRVTKTYGQFRKPLTISGELR